ncbi:hypothetical protein DFH06DRAFT_1136948 [Mycena polygramma]|nr:hypothetical protein DFH06DRAFT_1136948 [Mycena polygramma]
MDLESWLQSIYLPGTTHSGLGSPPIPTDPKLACCPPTAMPSDLDSRLSLIIPSEFEHPWVSCDGKQHTTYPTSAVEAILKLASQYPYPDVGLSRQQSIRTYGAFNLFIALSLDADCPQFEYFLQSEPRTVHSASGVGASQLESASPYLGSSGTHQNLCDMYPDATAHIEGAHLTTALSRWEGTSSMHFVPRSLAVIVRAILPTLGGKLNPAYKDDSRPSRSGDYVQCPRHFSHPQAPPAAFKLLCSNRFAKIENARTSNLNWGAVRVRFRFGIGSEPNSGNTTAGCSDHTSCRPPQDSAMARARRFGNDRKHRALGGGPTKAAPSPPKSRGLDGPGRLPVFRISETEGPKKQMIACLFCRDRKIACGRPTKDAPDQTCNELVIIAGGSMTRGALAFHKFYIGVLRIDDSYRSFVPIFLLQRFQTRGLHGPAGP